MTDSENLRYWIALTSIKDIGPITAKRLLSAFRTPRKIFEAGQNELSGVEDVGANRVKAVLSFDSWSRVDEDIAVLRQKNIRTICFTDTEYPVNLRQIDDSPIVLYAKGSLIEEDRYAVAMVGSRMMTEYGRRMAEITASELAAYGITVVSGMARGIDTVSHKGALKAGGRSIAVLGCGLDRPYPPENSKLFGDLCASGCVISEFPPGTPPNKENFPKRNRLISGLSLGVVVIEAAVDSGSLITARYALEQNRDVFAVPGSLLSKNSEGTNSLIKKGAKLVQKTADILEELSPQIRGMLKTSGLSLKNQDDRLDRLEINEEEKAICTALGNEPRHIDVISRELDMAHGKLLGLLSCLEIKGVIRQIEGKKFYRI